MATDTILEALVFNNLTRENAEIPETKEPGQFYLDNDTSLEKVEHDDTLTGDGTADSPLSVVGGGAGGLPDQTGHTGYLKTDGTDASWSDTEPLVNNSTRPNSLSILGSVSTSYGLAVGQGATVSGTQAVAVGWTASAGSTFAVAVGPAAKALASRAVQIGPGTNSDANTVKISNNNGNFQIMNTDGTIPSERLAGDGTTGQILSKTDTGMAWTDAPSGGSAVSKGNYCTTYGIITLPSDITTNATTNVLNMPASIVMKTPSGRMTSSSAFTHTVTSTTNFTLFYAGGQWLECGKVDYSESEPDDNGVDNYQAWWNGTVWQFKSNDSGNVWREVENATPVCDCFFTGSNLTRIETVGYVWGRGVNKADIDNINTSISSINTNIDSLYEELSANALPTAPASAGTYVLKATVAADGTVTKEWVEE